MSAGKPTRLECIGDAAVGTISAFLYPSDPEIRLAAVEASALAGVDYIEAVAAVMESKPDATPDAARWAVAVGVIRALAGAISDGDAPRVGINAIGQEIGGLGYPIEPDTEEGV